MVLDVVYATQTPLHLVCGTDVALFIATQIRSEMMYKTNPRKRNRALACCNCDWWAKRSDYPNGFCRIYGRPQHSNIGPPWPTTNGDDWCPEHSGYINTQDDAE